MPAHTNLKLLYKNTIKTRMYWETDGTSLFFNPYPEENALKLKCWNDMISNKSGIRFFGMPVNTRQHAAA